MAKDPGLVKVVDTSVNSTKKSLARLGVGALAGAGVAAALLKKLTPKSDHYPGGPGSDVGPMERLEPFDRKAAGIEDEKAEKGPKGKVMRLAERKGWRWLGRTLQVQRRYGELQGNNVASAVALQLFLAVFPLLLVATAIIGFIASGNEGEVVMKILKSLGLPPSAGDTVSEAVMKASQNSGKSGIVGLVTAIWSALGITSALQYAYNQAWQSGGRGVKDKAVGLSWMVGAAFLFAASAAVSTAINWFPAGAGVLATVVSIALSFALWMLTGKLLPNVHVSWRELIPGAILGTIGLEVMKLLGVLYVPHAVASQSAAYGVAGVVLAVLAFVVLFGKLVMYSAVLNVITYESNHGKAETVIEVPRAALPEEGVTRGGVTDRN